MNNLTDISKLKIHLGIADTDVSQDVRLEQLIDGVSQAVRRYCGRDFNSAQRTEYFSGDGTEWVYLPHRPATAIVGVWLDSGGYYGQSSGGFADPATLLTQGVDYYCETLESNERNPSRLVRIAGSWPYQLSPFALPIGAARAYWPYGRGNIKVTYTAGYREMPDDLEMAVHMLCAQTKNSIKYGSPVRSETFGRYSYELLAGSFERQPPEVGTIKSILSGYTECPI